MLFINRSRIRFRKFIRLLSIPRGKLVLDVGSGDGPFARANILCDMHISDTLDRIGPIQIDRPFVAGDIMALPFRDKTFDYVYCSHVLEHVEEPERALKELMRIGRGGFIETPSEFLEKLKCSPGHRWYVRVRDRTLIFQEKERDVFDPLIQEVAEIKMINKDRSFMNFYWKNYYNIFNISHEWSGKIDFEVIRSANRYFSSRLQGQNSSKPKDSKAGEKEYFLKAAGLLKSIIKRLYLKNIDLYELLVCPICKGPLELKDTNLICYNCSRGFYIKNEIPILIEGYSFDA